MLRAEGAKTSTKKPGLSRPPQPHPNPKHQSIPKPRPPPPSHPRPAQKPKVGTRPTFLPLVKPNSTLVPSPPSTSNDEREPPFKRRKTAKGPTPKPPMIELSPAQSGSGSDVEFKVTERYRIEM